MIVLNKEIPTSWFAELMVDDGSYLDFATLLALIPEPNHDTFRQIIYEHESKFVESFGSSHNHQAWKGGFGDHVVECLNIACQLYRTLNGLRKLPFKLHEALEVLFLHDIEKPFKTGDRLLYKGNILPIIKVNRKTLRAWIIRDYGITLTPEQENALRYVEGVPDSEYIPGERTMGELAAFCHCCDVLSARLWHDKGSNVPTPDWE